MLLKIGITGGIGSGKSTVSKIFKFLGVPVFEADTEAKKLYSQPSVKEKIIQQFGDEVYIENQLDSKRMASIVFHSPEQLKLLNQLLHPLVEEQFNQWALLQKSQYVIKEAALLIESGSYKQLDYLILVTCPLEMRIQQVINRDKLSREDVLVRIHKQLPEDEKRPYCQFEINNDKTLLLIPQVLEIHQQLSKSYSVTKKNGL